MKRLLLLVFTFLFLFSAGLRAYQSTTNYAQDGWPLFELDIADVGEDFFFDTSTWTLDDNYIRAMVNALDYWSALLGNVPSNASPILVSVGTNDEENASATSLYSANSGFGMTQFGGAIIGYNTDNMDSSADKNPNYLKTVYAAIIIGNLDFVFDDIDILSNSGKIPLSVTMAHEIGHAAGIISNAKEDSGNWIFFPYDTSSPSPALTKYDSYLVDSFGNAASLNEIIISTDTSEYVFDPSFFAIIKEGDDSLDDPSKGGYAFFQGSAVLEVMVSSDGVLGGAVQLFNNPYEIQGLPINGYEGDVDIPAEYIPELSHLELRNSMMSHQNWRNYGTFIEAELALLEDIGFLGLERRSMFGYSIYFDNAVSTTIYNNFYERNLGNFVAHSTNSAPLTIGLHIFGHTNNVIMKGEVLTDGAKSVGIRVDGWDNNLTVDSNIQANGEDGSALMLAYGKGHIITISSHANLSAIGGNGIGARIDFGHNLASDFTETRGSYIRTMEDIDSPLLFELDGAMLDKFDINGKIAGKTAAIYIATNSFVKEINIMQEAKIDGAIISDWNPYSPNIQYASSREDLKTKIKFGAQADSDGHSTPNLDNNFDFVWNNNVYIKGKSLDIIVLGGLVEYYGQADISSFLMSSGTLIVGKIATAQEPYINADNIKFNSVSSILISSNALYIEQSNHRITFSSDNYKFLRISGLNINLPTVYTDYVLPDGFYDYAFVLSNSRFSLIETLNGAKSAKETISAPLAATIQNTPSKTVFTHNKNMLDNLENESFKDYYLSPWTDISYSFLDNSGYDYSIDGINFASGVDWRFDEDKFTGLAISYGLPTYSGKHNTKIDIAVLQLFLYGGWHLDLLDLSAFASMGFNSYEQTRVFDGKYS
ncbi:MAG: autotransporter outer membrane beta-barrel domain-containing protein, partial [Endomicrobium sp.]|nr:autotransporter outer membrane beta-barrel domain-containing protein [Endomicrobium sp.]